MHHTWESKLIGVYTFMVLLLVTSTYGSPKAKITMTDNKYNGLFVAIHEDVAENEILIENLKEYITEMSSSLFTALKFRGFIGDVTILVPSTWKNKTYEQASSEHFSMGNILIKRRNVSNIREHGPLTKQPGFCGEEGIELLLSEKYVLDKTFAQENWGHIGKCLAHEWAHLRYGVFDEYPVGKNSTQFYTTSSGTTEYVRCNLAIKGTIVKSDVTYNDVICELDPITGLYQDGCTFKPNPNTAAKASLMFYSWIYSINTFCDDADSDSAIVHNAEAPNLQNTMCDGRSVWSVIREHNDFKNGSNPVRNQPPVNPTFRVIQEQSSRWLVLALDISASMLGRGILNQGQAVGKYLDDIEPGVRVGIVAFSDVATVVANMTYVGKEKDRDFLRDKIPMVVTGQTCIGCAIELALELLNVSGNFGCEIILFTDGKENKAPFLEDVKPRLFAKGVIFHSVMYGRRAEATLDDLSRTTGGESMFYSGSTLSTGLDDALPSTIRDSPNKSVQLLSERKKIAPLKSVTFSSYLDSGLGRKTTWEIIYYTKLEDFTLILKYPTGTKTLTSSWFKVFDSLKLIRIKVPTGRVQQVGLWELVVTNNSNKSSIYIGATFRSKPRNSKTEVVTMTPYMGSKRINVKGDLGVRTAVIRAEVSKAMHPIVDANVTAIVQSSRYPYPTFIVHLYDTGTGADSIKNDGIYSAFFTKFNANAKYNIKLLVTGNRHSKILKWKYSGMGSAMFLNNNVPEVEYSEEIIGDFVRVSTGGFFTVEGIDNSLTYASQDNVPPARITDVTVSVAANRSIVLMFTASGDDMDDGKASGYVINIARTVAELRKSFTNASNPVTLESFNVISGNTSAANNPGTMELFVIEMTAAEHDVAYFIGLVVYDDAALVSDISNIASFTFIHNITKHVPIGEQITDDPAQVVIETGKNTFTEPAPHLITSEITNPTFVADSFHVSASNSLRSSTSLVSRSSPLTVPTVHMTTLMYHTPMLDLEELTNKQTDSQDPSSTAFCENNSKCTGMQTATEVISVIPQPTESPTATKSMMAEEQSLQTSMTSYDSISRLNPTSDRTILSPASMRTEKRDRNEATSVHIINNPIITSTPTLPTITIPLDHTIIISANTKFKKSFDKTASTLSERSFTEHVHTKRSTSRMSIPRQVVETPRSVSLNDNPSQSIYRIKSDNSSAQTTNIAMTSTITSGTTDIMAETTKYLSLETKRNISTLPGVTKITPYTIASSVRYLEPDTQTTVLPRVSTIVDTSDQSLSASIPDTHTMVLSSLSTRVDTSVKTPIDSTQDSTINLQDISTRVDTIDKMSSVSLPYKQISVTIPITKTIRDSITHTTDLLTTVLPTMSTTVGTIDKTTVDLVPPWNNTNTHVIPEGYTLYTLTSFTIAVTTISVAVLVIFTVFIMVFILRCRRKRDNTSELLPENNHRNTVDSGRSNTTMYEPCGNASIPNHSSFRHVREGRHDSGRSTSSRISKRSQRFESDTTSSRGSHHSRISNKSSISNKSNLSQSSIVYLP
ncbi:unnamed protein product [Owenia fusiformis]|uniref:Uncharacterized protein n=1 Tax=Owenia fusiformis TaxID=6347 RepID=A0A8J1TN41_OWEFU|nr:unnamed protein product [Owenia fusiformis]